MDTTTFDTLSRSVATSLTRRSALRGLVASAAAAVAGGVLLSAEDSSAKRRGGKGGKGGKGARNARTGKSGKGSAKAAAAARSGAAADDGAGAEVQPQGQRLEFTLDQIEKARLVPKLVF